jgi:hypothetical protein
MHDRIFPSDDMSCFPQTTRCMAPSKTLSLRTGSSHVQEAGTGRRQRQTQPLVMMREGGRGGTRATLKSEQGGRHYTGYASSIARAICGTWWVTHCRLLRQIEEQAGGKEQTGQDKPGKVMTKLRPNGRGWRRCGRGSLRNLAHEAVGVSGGEGAGARD